MKPGLQLRSPADAVLIGPPKSLLSQERCRLILNLGCTVHKPLRPTLQHILLAHISRYEPWSKNIEDLKDHRAHRLPALAKAGQQRLFGSHCRPDIAEGCKQLVKLRNDCIANGDCDAAQRLFQLPHYPCSNNS